MIGKWMRAFRNWWTGPPAPPRPSQPVDWTPSAESFDEMRRGVPLPRIEARVRDAWRWTQGSPSPEYAEGVFALPDAPVELVGILSFHPDGFVREAAVRRLDAFDTGAELPFLLLRLTDWVAEVREVARAAVDRRMRPAKAPLLIRHFPLFARAMGAARGEGPILTAALASVFSTDEGKAALRTALNAAIAKFVLRHVPEAIDGIVESAFVMDDPIVRLMLVPVIAQPMLLRLAHDPFPAVRREALVTLARVAPEDAKPLLEQAVTDRSAMVRHAASVLLGGDIAGRYRTALAAAETARPIAAAISGLAEWGNAADAETLAPYLTHASALVRRAAIKGVMRLAGDRYRDRVLPMLNDASRGVSAAARDALRKQSIGLDVLLALFRSATHLHARTNVLALCALLPKWDAGFALLTAAAHEDAGTADRAVTWLAVWNFYYNRTNVPPSRRQIEDIRAALERAAPRLGDRLLQELRFSLQPFTDRQ